jgi:PAS domain-containing protein
MKSFNLLINKFDAPDKNQDPENSELSPENSAIFNAIVESSPNLMAIVQDGCYVFMNTCGLKMMKCKSPDKIIGKEIKETVAHGYEAAIPNLTEASHKSVHLKMVRLDSSEFYAEIDVAPFSCNNKPATLLIGRDITSELEQKLFNEQEQKLRDDILNAFTEVIAFYSPTHDVIWLNEAGKKQLNIHDNSYIGTKCFKLWFNSRGHCYTCPLVHNNYETTERVVTFDDKHIWKIRNIPLYNSDRNITGYIEFRRDITDEVTQEKKQKQVAADALYITQKNTILSEIETVLQKTLMNKKLAGHKKEFKRIFEIIDSYKQLDKDWKMLIANFEEVHPGFFKKLTDSYPLLSPNDIKHCACIKMNFDTKEIARFFNIKASSVQISRVRLKKKMNLADTIDLRNFLLNF